MTYRDEILADQPTSYFPLGSGTSLTRTDEPTGWTIDAGYPITTGPHVIIRAYRDGEPVDASDPEVARAVNAFTPRH